MTAPGYETIGIESGGGGVEGVKAYGDDGEVGVEGGYQSIAEKAGNVISTAKAATEGVKAAVTDNNIYTDPINPSAEMSLRDRITLVLESARPWGEFVSPGNFGKPAAGDMQVRVSHNLETFFYNYVIIGVLFALVMTFLHPIKMISLGLIAALALFLYVLHPEPIPLLDGKIVLETNAKHAVFIAALVLSFFLIHVGGIVVTLVLVLGVAVGLHAIFHEHENY
eukprot:CAMPEP_0185845184 /NCGR_PEP_ID=MMETSP1354-20130828/1212_1 /TAXON_ID=708628 /ORGANISM="Erythrolobus madagascarensis, Strain CCMP3276" /LENGTH=223 /DNA_ID=CAMNT_0028545079 /DNA_START=48 /DNA_END=719 /DNA_ORIENTATION=+